MCGGGQRGTEGGDKRLQTTAHVTIAECGQPDYLSSKRQTWELWGRPLSAHGDRLTTITHTDGWQIKGKINIKCQSKVSGHHELPEQLECTLAKVLKEVYERWPDNQIELPVRFTSFIQTDIVFMLAHFLIVRTGCFVCFTLTRSVTTDVSILLTSLWIEKETISNS